MVQMNENITGIDSAIFMHPEIWKASGHVEGFNDPMIDNKDSKRRYRANNLLEDRIAKYEKEGKNAKASRLQEQLNTYLKADDLEGLKQLIEEHAIAYPVSDTLHWTDFRPVKLMFSPQLGAHSGINQSFSL